MSGLCGWLHHGHAGPAATDVTSAMAVAITRVENSAARSVFAGFGSVSAAGGDANVFEGEGKLVGVWGRIQFTDTKLAVLAQRHGAAAALAQGYERMGTDVLTALTGTFALAILDGRRGEAGARSRARR